MGKKKFDYLMFGCNEKQVREFARHFGLDEDAIPKKKGGVIVRPGDRVRNGRDERRVVTNLKNARAEASWSRTFEGTKLPTWDEYSNITWAGFDFYTTLDGAPVIGYHDPSEDDE